LAPTPSTPSCWADLRVVALAGGVGGARLAYGLAALLPPEQLSIIVNTGDDFENLGLTICPDVDTVTYTLAGLSNLETGWGIAGDSFHTLDQLRQLGEDVWFHLGDRDLATHLLRTRWLQGGGRLTDFTHELCKQLGIGPAILPMTDDPCHTMVLTELGELDFQTYFVRHAWQPRILSLRWDGLERAKPTPEVLASLKAAHLVVLCPSNPFVSIDPILKLPGLPGLIAAKTCVAVSPIIAGQAVKGPAAKMFAELGIPASAFSIAQHYQDLLKGIVLDDADTGLVERIQTLGMQAIAMPTLMKDLPERIEVARGVLEFGAHLLGRN
jgi:LPPG:FO 2-phospho-L-lactate transferase